MEQDFELEYLAETSQMDDLGYVNDLVKGEQWLLSVNVRSVVAKEFKLKEVLSTHKPAIVALQEVWQANNVHLSFDQYNFEYETRTKRRGGGVGLLIDSSITYTKRRDLSMISDDLEVIGVDTKHYTILSIYIPPNANIGKSIMDLEYLCSLCTQNSLFICGDFNVDFSKHTSKTTSFNDFFLSLQLVPLINKPTRRTNTSSTQIDNIVTNCKIKMKSGILLCDVSDHLGPFVSLSKTKSKKGENPCIYQRNISPRNVEKLRKMMQNIHWKITNSDPATLFSDFFLQLTKALKYSCPVKIVHLSNLSKIPG